VNTYMAEVRITPRAGLLDPEGQAIRHALRSLDFDDIEDVRVGRLVLLRVLADSDSAAAESAEEMCRKLLANPVTEDFRIAVRKGE
jgi:phosphoribosylformylglycinamidine synthase subunit PurS